MYEPEDDPFLANEEIEEYEDSPEPKPKPNQPKGQRKPGPYQYQPHQSMYNMSPPNGPQPARGIPGPGPPPPHFAPGPGYAPGMMPPPGPGLRPTNSFYGDPNLMAPPYMVQPQPYGMPPPVMLPPPPQPIYASPPAYPTTASYRDRTAISEQIEALQQYERSRPPSYGNSSTDNSLLIATLVSEQDALYGTNMLENITPADDEYIRGLMARGVPEHEALRMTFDRKPHPPRPRKPVTEVDSVADAHALEQAIQLSLTESSRRASQPSYSSGLGATSTDLADQEALETAIQLSLREAQEQQNRYRQYEQDYSSAAYSGESHDRQAASASSYSANYAERYDRAYESNARQYAGEDRGYERRGSGSEAARYEVDLAPVPTSFDRQYPYNLAREDPDEVLHRNYTVSNVDKYRLAQQQQQEYLDHLQSSGALDPPPPHHHHHRHTEEYDQYSREVMTARSTGGDVVRETAEELRARAYGRAGPRDPAPPATYREQAPGYASRGKESGYDAYDYQQQQLYQEHHGAARYAAEDARSLSSRGREYGGDDRYDYGEPPYSSRGPPPAYHEPYGAREYDRYDRAPSPDYGRAGPPPQYGDDRYSPGPPPPHYAVEYDERAPPPGYDDYDRAPPPAYGDARGAPYDRSVDERYDTYGRQERFEHYRDEQYIEQRSQPPPAAYSSAYPPSGAVKGAPMHTSRSDGTSDSDGDSKRVEVPRLQSGSSANVSASAKTVSAATAIRAEATASSGTGTSERPMRVLTRAPSARELVAPADTAARSPTPPAAAGASAFPPTLHQRGLQQVAQTTTSTTTAVEYTAASSRVATSAQSAQLQRPPVPSRPPQLTPPTLAARPPLTTSTSFRGPPPAAAAALTAVPEDMPSEFADDDDGAFAKKHEWRKTLKNLVNDLTAPSDDSYQSK